MFKKIYFVLPVMFLFTGCAVSTPVVYGAEKQTEAVTETETPVETPTLTVTATETETLIEAAAETYVETPVETIIAVIPDNPKPGEPITIGTRAGSGAVTAVLVVDGRRLSRGVFFPVPSETDESGNRTRPFRAAILTIPSTARPGSAVIVLEGNGGAADAVGSITINIAGRDFLSETIRLNNALTRILTEPNPQRTAEAEHLWAILNRAGTEVYATGYFSPPVNSTRRTSHFGSRRVFINADGSRSQTIHAGVDYGVPTGTRIASCAPGKVVLARHRIISGYSVIVEHLPGVYSLYYHLDSIDVNEGDIVTTGTLLGLSGSTGLSTGPHLHWELRVLGENTDPDTFISRPILDKNLILSKLEN